MNIVTAKEMYDIDHYTIREIGMDGKLLMENAGRAVSEKVKQLAGIGEQIIILIGPGNNGGDGFVIARTLLEEDYCVKTVQVVPDEKVTGDANYHKNLLIKSGGTVTFLESNSTLDKVIAEADLIIDAILGIGVKGKLREPIASIVEKVNHSKATVISVDIPSGLPADEGFGDFVSVQADYTYVIGAAKESAFIPTTAIYYGNWEVVSIGFPKKVIHQFSKRNQWTEQLFKETLPKREKYSHKGNHGKGLVVGGSVGMPGSITMTVQAALKAGAGLITAGTVKENIPIIASKCSESMYLPLPGENGFLTNEGKISLFNYHAIAVGIGVGRANETTELVRDIINQANCPVIIDADGVYHMKATLSEVKRRQAATIITPHPGEMAMLLGTSISEVLASPFSYAQQFAKEFGVHVVLKGKHTIITTPDGKQTVNSTGNQGLAKGGSGDVLTGITLAMVMQHQDIFQSLCNACYLHGKAADMQVDEQNTVYDLLASDVINGIPKVYRTIS
ncbi:NAD(P)H-hydrate dehydratase [Oceanobacillus halophilus]|uniref:Bifunctional NAD(P)H-hydrate repair enzyme n=1 Tax=Oceanobacillus halophilus TaxID=930130 RepID=A0A494ZWA5_9BACI|nr:NAD(P)H-hydrate dehydratase [Oceanobacillus halophilus]RKQ30926.1 NAD(P)H-hydrate dehydratase [Oceanobacillus halophilus]